MVTMTHKRSNRTLAIGPLESLDQRIVPSGTGITSMPIATQEAFVATRAGQTLGSVFTQYVSYEQGGAVGAFAPTQAGQIFISGTSVGVDIDFHGGDFNTLVGQLKSIGMQVTATAPQVGLVEGYLPIGDLPIVASNGYATSISPVYRPVNYPLTPATGVSASNEALVTTRGGLDLGTIYTQYVNFETEDSQGTFTSTLANKIFISGTSVGVDISVGNGGNFNTVLSQLECRSRRPRRRMVSSKVTCRSRSCRWLPGTVM
jgi:hypothetical protein